NATPHDTWRGFDLALNGAEHGWTGHGPQGDGPGVGPGEGLSWPKVTSVDSKQIDYRVSRGGAEFLHMKLQ
ncbi:hypothetical protein, partial [Klebsiella aerogenes]